MTRPRRPSGGRVVNPTAEQLRTRRPALCGCWPVLVSSAWHPLLRPAPLTTLCMPWGLLPQLLVMTPHRTHPAWTLVVTTPLMTSACSSWQAEVNAAAFSSCFRLLFCERTLLRSREGRGGGWLLRHESGWVGRAVPHTPLASSFAQALWGLPDTAHAGPLHVLLLPRVRGLGLWAPGLRALGSAAPMWSPRRS